MSKPIVYVTKDITDRTDFGTVCQCRGAGEHSLDGLINKWRTWNTHGDVWLEPDPTSPRVTGQVTYLSETKLNDWIDKGRLKLALIGFKNDVKDIKQKLEIFLRRGIPYYFVALENEDRAFCESLLFKSLDPSKTPLEQLPELLACVRTKIPAPCRNHNSNDLSNGFDFDFYNLLYNFYMVDGMTNAIPLIGLGTAIELIRWHAMISPAHQSIKEKLPDPRTSLEFKLFQELLQSPPDKRRDMLAK